MLELKDIKKGYQVGDNFQQVLKGIDINFRRNEFVSILGHSGSGKTTLLNLIGGLDKYDSGDLIIENISTKLYNDRDWDSYRNYRVGFIFQSYNLIMHQSVLANVEMALTLSGVSKKERLKKATAALEKVGLKEHIDKKPNQLSGGQMQRVAIARALVNDPEIILADEPTGALDSKTSVQIMDLLKEIAKDKLVIMVTHNPELAKEYSTRIVELKDGIIINDSNPYDGKGEKTEGKKANKTSMSILTSLSLSFNNLLTKKGRTFLTAFAGSIGIIGIALILALSTGVKNYATNLEKESLSDYPISLQRTSYDLLGTIAAAFDMSESTECEEGKICSNDDLVKTSIITSEGIVKKSDITSFKKYLDENGEIDKYADKIIYSYDFELQVYTKDYLKVNPSNLTETSTNIFNELSSSKYKVLAGKMPEKYNEIVLVVGVDKNVSDSTLYSLGIKDRKELSSDLEKIIKDNSYKVESSSYSYEDFLNKTYKLILNTDYYKEEKGIFIDHSNDLDYMKNKINNGIELTIVGVIEDENATSSIGYTHDLTLHILKETSKTSIYEKQRNNREVNLLTGEAFDGFTNTYDDVEKQLAIYDLNEPSTINIYPKDYNSKEAIVKMIKDYNEEMKKNNEPEKVIEYNDLMKTLIGGITKVVSIVSAVLIAFVAISLIVSSIMISIITYISVLERTKEIGILRAIGASKKDIVRVFRAETIIEGAIAGILGIVVALLITIPVNAVVAHMAKINGIANMPFGGAIFLILLSIGLNVLAGTIPSKMAAKKDPVEALRTE
jgi:putative ABC transport system permease protein